MKSRPRDRMVSKTSRLLAGLIALVVPFEVAAAEPGAPPSVSCLGPEGERYLQGLLDRIHRLETQLDAEVEAHLSERAEAERRLSQQAASAVDPPKQPAEADGFDREQARKELAALRAALDEATAARRRAEAEAAAASQTAVTFANALKEAESRLEAADKKLSSEAATREVEEAAPLAAVAVAHPQEQASKPETEAPTEVAAPPSENDRPEAAPAAAPRAEVPVAETLPTATPAALSEAELAAAQLAALTGRRAAGAVHDAPPAAAPEPSPKPVAAAAAAPTPAPPAEPESARAAAQLAALTGKRSIPSTNPAPAPTEPTEVATPAEPAALGAVEAPPARNRCDEPPENALIEPGDRLSIHVDHLKEVSDTVEVESDGRVHLALVGTLPAAGRNQREFVAELTQRLTPYLQAPRVDVALQRDCGR